MEQFQDILTGSFVPKHAYRKKPTKEIRVYQCINYSKHLKPFKLSLTLIIVPEGLKCIIIGQNHLELMDLM